MWYSALYFILHLIYYSKINHILFVSFLKHVKICKISVMSSTNKQQYYKIYSLSLQFEPQSLPENEAESWPFHNSDHINFSDSFLTGSGQIEKGVWCLTDNRVVIEKAPDEVWQLNHVSHLT